MPEENQSISATMNLIIKKLQESNDEELFYKYCGELVQLLSDSINKLETQFNNWSLQRVESFVEITERYYGEDKKD